jgi:hypothetical protein
VADYYSILFRAVSALEPNTASARQRLYERARSAMSAEIEGASPPFDASEIAAAKQGLKSAIERIEAEALPAWLQQPQNAACTNDCAATADPLPDEGACRLLDASEIAAAKQGLERWLQQQPQRPTCANDCPATADLPAEIEEACRPFDPSEIDGVRQALKSAADYDCSATADLPADIERAFRPFHASEIVAAEHGLESAIERTESQVIPDWLRQPERVVRTDDCPTTAANQNEDSPGLLKKLWGHLTRRTAEQCAAPIRETWSEPLERGALTRKRKQVFCVAVEVRGKRRRADLLTEFPQQR